MLDEDTAFLALHLLPGVGPKRCKRLLERFASASQILSASRNDLKDVVGASVAKAIRDWENLVDLDYELRSLEQAGGRIITWHSELYPPMLREIHAPPLVLSGLGEITREDHQALAVVGTRRMTRYGKSSTRSLTFPLSQAGFTIVSGLAYGVDTEAHEAALAAGGRTLAVLGSGLGHLYPRENRELAERISQHGAVLSQFPFDTKPDPRLFPARNHIVSGMSRAVLVIVGGRRSGSMLTADAALQQNRQVFALPGPVDRAAS
ncbi:MAG: DNA-processing protein DprA, partial [Verrucomicrobiota bacterium]